MQAGRSYRRWIPVVLLGLATIGAYGTTYYAIGVLIPAIREDEGWSTSLLSGGFSLGVLAQGAVALMAGRAFDKYGSRPILLPAMLVGVSCLLLASLATQSWQFFLAWVAGSSAIGGGLYYNVTMPVVTRLYPERRAGALSLLTLLGALASPIFYPLAGLLIELWGWRGAMQGLTLTTLDMVAPAAILVRAPAALHESKGGSLGVVRQALKETGVHRLLLVVALAGLANSALILNQVPSMEAAGLSVAAASAFAGARGAFQIPGRLLLMPLTSRIGVRSSIGVCYLVAATAAAVLLLSIGVPGSFTLVLVGYFCVAGGMSLGLLSPLNGLFQAEVFGDSRLGTLSGISVCVVSLASAAGAFLSATLIDLTGTYEAGLGMVVMLQLSAVAALHWQSRSGIVIEPGTLQHPAGLPH